MSEAQIAIMESLLTDAAPHPITGSLSVLNVGEGDIHITFNNADPAETEKAVAMLLDMQKRGYAIMVQLPDNTYVRAQSIDATTGSYIVVLPDEIAAATLAEPAAASPEGAKDGESAATEKPSRGRPSKKASTSLPIAGTRAVGVARSAGG